MKLFSQLKYGRLQVQLPDGTRLQFGEESSDQLEANVEILDESCFQQILLGGSLSAAEAYLERQWTTDDLTVVMRLMCRNLTRLTAMDGGWARLARSFAVLKHRFMKNTHIGSRRNIAAHYDLSNEFFQLFLDPTLMYSSGLFTSPQMTMQEASVEKLERICRKLSLKQSDHVVENGTGWGGFALHAASNYGCRVTTTTISDKQYELARERIESAGLQDRVTLLREDYRHLTGVYDKLVSIEMIEAVGQEFLPAYFQACNRLLKPGGTMLVQAITMPDYRYDEYSRGVDFIQKYIFPGGHLPSVGAMQASVEKTSLNLVDALQFPESYMRTLQCWKDEFTRKSDAVRSLGFDERFLRMWMYYLCYCEAAFQEHTVSVGQFVWEKSCFADN
ncbi:cyclopropane-fatty-acyl-phospholipid synthase family protein [Thalassoglobus sp. JC818]|uniref:cyclopropane-fatty-acyl-phospholipid synthase family protein n=1 Tax=Thalassoglobus sp. JC818 TaxID=3232136 RepID=UPI003457C877